MKHGIPNHANPALQGALRSVLPFTVKHGIPTPHYVEKKLNDFPGREMDVELVGCEEGTGTGNDWSAASFAARVATNKMAFEESTRHKSGPLKQQNKTHKHGRHRSKSEIDKTNKGTVTHCCLFNFV